MFTSRHDSSSPTPRTQRPWFVTTTAVISASSLSCFSRDCGTRISSMLVLCSVTDAETLCEPVLSTSTVAPSWNVASPTSPCEYAGAGDAYGSAARQATTTTIAAAHTAAAARRRDTDVTATFVTPTILVVIIMRYVLRAISISLRFKSHPSARTATSNSNRSGNRPAVRALDCRPLYHYAGRSGAAITIILHGQSGKLAKRPDLLGYVLESLLPERLGRNVKPV